MKGIPGAQGNGAGRNRRLGRPAPASKQFRGEARSLERKLTMNDMSRTLDRQDVWDRRLLQLVPQGPVNQIRNAIDAGADPNARDRQWGMTALLLAVEWHRLDVIELLGQAGADPNEPRRGMDRFTPLHMAAWRNNLDSVYVLLKMGADAAKRTWLTPIDWAEGRAIIETLVNAGADPNARCPGTGNTPLHRRACRCLPEPMAALLEAGANVEATDLQGRTPLHHVTLGHRRGDVAEAVRLLIEAGADPAALDENCHTALSLARSRRDAVAVRALVKARPGTDRAPCQGQHAHAKGSSEELRFSASARGT